MRCNVGALDKLLRITIGLLVVILGLVFNSWLGLIGLIPIATGLFRFCPAYLPFKFSTAKNQ